MSNLSEQVKTIIDWSALGVTLSTLFDKLPEFAALVSIIWGLIRIYETRTVQKLLGKDRKRFIKYVKDEYSEDS